MTLWWTSLSVFMKVLWGITLTASLIFIIQSILTFIGADSGDGGIDADFDASGADIDVGASDNADLGAGGSNLYTFRNFVNFFLGFGWTAVLLSKDIQSRPLLMLISIIVGVALVAIVMYLFKWLNSMQQSGTINVYKQAVDCQGKVYLTIPAERAGQGKVQISINNSIREYDAVTDGDKLIDGTAIKVVDVIDANTLLVEPLNSLII